MADESGLVQVNAERITRARETRLMSKLDLANKVGVSNGTVANWELTGALRAAHFNRMCEVLKFPPPFFFVKSQAQIVSPKFRLLRQTTPRKSLKQAEGYGFLVGQFLHVLDASVGLPPVTVPDIPLSTEDPDLKKVDAAANQVRTLLGYEIDPVPNATRSVETTGAAVVFSPAFSSGIDAYSMWSGDRPIIVQASSDPARLRFDLFHEYGHLVMHKNDLDDPRLDDLSRVRRHRVREIQAHRFAGAILLPETDQLLDELDDALTGRYWTKPLDMKARWGVSLQLLLRRARDLNVIDQTIYDERWADLAKRAWKTREPGRIAFPELPSLVAHLYADLREAYPDADERLKKFHGISDEFLQQFTARAVTRRPGDGDSTG